MMIDLISVLSKQMEDMLQRLNKNAYHLYHLESLLQLCPQCMSKSICQFKWLMRYTQVVFGRWDNRTSSWHRDYVHWQPQTV